MSRTRGVISIAVVVGLFAACPADDADEGGDDGAASSGESSGCPAGTEGCACKPETPACDPLLVCQADVCVIDMEGTSSTGPTTSQTTQGSQSASDSTADGSGSDSTGGADGSSGAETGEQTCANSRECPRGQVCTAPAASPGVPAGPFTCGETCAGFGADSPVCSDDASCCGAFCLQGSCAAP